VVRRRGVDETRVSVTPYPTVKQCPLHTQIHNYHPIAYRCKTLFATHAERLRDLSRVYPNVRSSAMAVDLRSTPHARGGNRGGIECRYR
jgi:hypothetical protein